MVPTPGGTRIRGKRADGVLYQHPGNVGELRPRLEAVHVTMFRTLILAYPNCILFEILPAAQRLDPYLPVRVATPDGTAFRDRSGLSVNAYCSFADAEAGDYACVLVPGGNPDEIIQHPDAARIICSVHSQGGIVAGICAGVAVLGHAGVLRGRRIAHNYTEDDVPAETRVHTDPLWRDTTYAPGG